MYYLDCINSLLSATIPAKYRDYDYFCTLSNSTVDEIVALSALLSPDIFIEKNIIIISSRLVEEGYGNEFYSIENIKKLNIVIVHYFFEK